MVMVGSYLVLTFSVSVSVAGVLLGEGGLLVHKLLGALPEGHLRCQYSSD